MRILASALLLTGSAFSWHLQAAPSCNALSEAFVQQGDTYYNLPEFSAGRAADQQAFLRLAESWQGEREGSLSRSECRGGDQPQWEQGDHSLKARLEVQAGTLRLEARWANKKAQSQGVEKLQFFGKSPVATFVALGGNRFLFSQKQRMTNTLPNRQKYSRLEEVVYQVEFKDNILLLQASRYINGAFYAEELWRLKR
jgi:hypothetical protein